jgi:hypothetical protein
MMNRAALLCLFAIAVDGVVPPTFTPDFVSQVQSNVMVASGVVEKLNSGGACCAADSPGCQLQGIFSLDKVEEQGSKDRRRLKTMCSDGPCILASLYGDVMKQMKLAPGSSANSTHKFVCSEYCPLSGNFTSEVQIGGIDNQSSAVKYLGKVRVEQQGVGGKTETCDHYQWSEMLFHVIPIQTTDFFVSAGTKAPTPFFSTMSVLKGAAGVAFNSSYLDFTPASNLDGQFDIDPRSFASCPLSPGCSGGDDDAPLTRHRFGKPGIVQHRAATVPGSPSLPKFSKDYTAHEETLMLSNQGGTNVGTSVCCLPTTSSVNGECLVTRSAKRGMHYYDVTNQRERFEDAVSGQTMVTLYGNVSKDMLINVTGGVETCQEYCPLIPGEGIDAFAIDPNATDMGKATIDGERTERFQWDNFAKIPITGKLVKMQTVEFYANLETDRPVPVFSNTKFTPYGGPQTGSQNTTYTKYSAKTPPANKFAIAGVDDCPQAKDCQIEMWQSHRLATGRYIAFYQNQ